jgi:hypothetical protein
MKKGLDLYTQRKLKEVEFRRIVNDGYDRFATDPDYIAERKVTQYEGVDKKDIPPPLTKVELRMKKEVEDKVRLLLQRTELKGIADTARVVVSIAHKTHQTTIQQSEHTRSGASSPMSEEGAAIKAGIGLPFLDGSSHHSGAVSIQGRVKPIYNHSQYNQQYLPSAT